MSVADVFIVVGLYLAQEEEEHWWYWGPFDTIEAADVFADRKRIDGFGGGVTVAKVMSPTSITLI